MANVDPIELIESIAQSGGDIWESAVAAGIEAQEMLDEGRWTIGDLANLVGKKYGANMIGDFAKEIKYEVARVREYRRIARYWKNAIRMEILESTAGSLNWSHFAVALRLENTDDAKAFLLECADNDWTADRARIVLNERLGKPTPPLKLLDATEVCIVGIDRSHLQVQVLGIDLEAKEALMEAWNKGKPVKLTIHEVRDV